MQDVELFRQLLGLKTPWRVVSVTPDLEEKSLTIQIEWPAQTQGECPECSVACTVYDHREERAWRHLDTMQFKTLLVAQVPRVQCASHGVKSMSVPWADMRSQFTMLFERFAIDILLTASDQSKAAKLLGLSWDEIHAIQARAVMRGIARRKVEDVLHVGIDEKSFLRGQSYASMLYDLDGRRVLEVVPDRTEEAAVALLTAALPQETMSNMKAVAVDMWKPYLKTIQTLLPDAAIVHDKFHIVSYLTKMVDEVRRKEHKERKASGQDDLTGTKFVWLRNPENWSENDEATFDELQAKGLKVARAWNMKETFLALWNYTYEGPARKFFARWYHWATHSKLPPAIKVAKMLKRHIDNILTFLKHPITNAVAEGFNSKIQTVKANARGFRSFPNYRVAILFHCGKLDLYPH